MKKGQRPIVISQVRPSLDDGRYPVKREVGDCLTVTADIFKEGHDTLAAVILYRPQDEPDWREVPLRLVDNDGWVGSFSLEANTRYRFTIEAWTDRFGSWVDDVKRRAEEARRISPVNCLRAPGSSLRREPARRGPMLPSSTAP